MNNTQNQVYFKQLNGIRFIAVMLVLIDHWFAESLILPLGHLGVVIFFVLSGFLITRILFQNADECRISGGLIGLKIKNFIVRRSLRIFPIYFLICFLGILFNISPIRSNWVWMFTYTPNWYIIFHKQWIGVWDHFWSLAVEEQYYLIFPYAVFFLNPKKYLHLFASMIALGLATRIGFYVNHSNLNLENQWFINYVNPFAAIDCFGLGGLLAYLFHYQHKFLKHTNSIIFICFLTSIGVLYASHMQEFKHGNPIFIILERSIFGLFAFFILAHTIQSKNDFLGKFLCVKPVEYIGRISYGIYLYHNFIFNIFHKDGNTLFGFFDEKFGLSNYSFFHNHYLLFLLNFVFLVVISTLSWFCIESPINSLKKYFE